MSLPDFAGQPVKQVTVGAVEYTLLGTAHVSPKSLEAVKAAIDSGLTRDLYVSLGEEVEGGAWIVRLYIKPFIDWIWGGCVLMALGGALAASDRRYRQPGRGGKTT